MPYLHLDLPGTYPVQVKRELMWMIWSMPRPSASTVANS
jgi:hypothetical protein